MNDSKTYTISKDLYTAIIESVYHKGRCSINIIKHIYDEKEVLQKAIKTVEDQQYIYENRLTEEA
jgi:hypothetical protein